MRTLVVSFLFLGLVGCSSARVPVIYTAQNSVRGREGIAAGVFSYRPAKAGIKPNQIENDAIGNIYMDTDLANYVKRGFSLELDRSGFTAAPPQITADCTINQIKVADLGFSADWYFKMSCSFRDLDKKAVIWQAQSYVEKKGASKFGNLEVLQRYLNGLILESYEQIFSPETRRILSMEPASRPPLPRLSIGKKLYLKDGALFGEVSGIEPAHDFGGGKIAQGILAARAVGGSMWLTTDQAELMLRDEQP